MPQKSPNSEFGSFLITFFCQSCTNHSQKVFTRIFVADFQILIARCFVLLFTFKGDLNLGSFVNLR